MARLIVPASPPSSSIGSFKVAALKKLVLPPKPLAVVSRHATSRHVTLRTQEHAGARRSTQEHAGARKTRRPSLPTTSHSFLASPSRVMRSLSRSSGTPRVSGTQRCTKTHLSGHCQRRSAALGWH